MKFVIKLSQRSFPSRKPLILAFFLRKRRLLPLAVPVFIAAEFRKRIFFRRLCLRGRRPLLRSARIGSSERRAPVIRAVGITALCLLPTHIFFPLCANVRIVIYSLSFPEHVDDNISGKRNECHKKGQKIGRFRFVLTKQSQKQNKNEYRIC